MKELPDIFSVYRPYAGRCGVFCATGKAFSIASDLSSCYSPEPLQQLRGCLLVVASESIVVQVFLWRPEICDRHFVLCVALTIGNCVGYFLFDTTCILSLLPGAQDIPDLDNIPIHVPRRGFGEVGKPKEFEMWY